MANLQPTSDPYWSSAVLDRIELSAPTAPTYLRTASRTPRTTATRLAQQDVCPTPFPEEPIPASTLPPTAAAPKSMLYLAYGSNLCAETFQGRRGIRPLSQINVSAPSLRLVFDLPGLPYSEPCFANTAPRKVPKLPDPPKMPPDLPHPPTYPPTATRDQRDGQEKMLPGDPVWDKGLVGVVYEVTPEDFATIVATEGGGASYADILVPCLPLPPRMAVPEKPEWPELPKMFLAHTLYAPRVPAKPPGQGDGDQEQQYGEDGDDDHGNDDDDDGKWKMPGWMRRWARRLVMPVGRPDQDYAQASARYLKLIRDGAREHELPDEYQRYLAELRPYTITSLRQRVGMMLMFALFAPLFMLLVLGGKIFADENGRVPRWLAVYGAVLSNLIWMSYDNMFHPLFGDGERTEEEEADHHESWRRRGSTLRRASTVGDEENRLLADW